MTRLLFSSKKFLYLPDHPNQRSLHITPTPRTGGIAILFGLSIPFALFFTLKKMGLEPPLILEKSEIQNFLWLIGALLFVFGMSLWDDLKPLSPALRLFIHLLTATLLIGGAKIFLSSFYLPFLGTITLSPWIIFGLTLLFLTWLANLYNFMDGMDGFAGGMTCFGFAFLGVLAWMHDDRWLFFLTFSTVASSLGFLIYNFPRAKIFLGDNGSIPLGFLAGALSCLGIQRGDLDIGAALLIFSPFIVDATVTLFRRLWNGQKVWQAHREHYYQRLVLLGWGQKKTVLFEYVLMLLCGGSAMLYVQLGGSWREMILGLWIVFYASLIASIHIIEKSLKTKPTHEDLWKKLQS